ncbi:OTU domain-containing protein-like [Iris pallida]|uniref:OTU domain-containing protein-like n=1 Tax=Iris pallida TaxID=29817 RepID=A0AAX6DVG0_IRIPA|nr:OTU domain-containing protein-like [Iris pallida]KAJ6825925.1 OTU domain-containing protein-like [Iris pallida]
MNLRLSMPSTEKVSGVSWRARHTSLMAGGVSFGACLSFSTSGPVYAEFSSGNVSKNDKFNEQSVSSSHAERCL